MKDYFLTPPKGGEFLAGKVQFVQESMLIKTFVTGHSLLVSFFLYFF